MPRTKTIILARHAAFAWLVLAWCVSAGSAQEKDKADKRDLQAKEAAEQFMKAAWKGDIEAVMKAVDVPFYLKGRTNFGNMNENIGEREDLKKYLEAYLTPAPPGIEYKERAISSFGSLPPTFFSDQDNKFLKEIIDKKDRIVVFSFPRRIIALPVVTREGKAKVVGFVNLGLLSLALIAEEKEKADKNAAQAMKVAKETVQQFLKAAKAKDLDGLVKLADLPWYSDGTQIIKDQDRLKKLLKSAWVDFADNRRFPSGVLGITRVGEFSQILGKERLRPEEVLAKDDWVVILARDGVERGYLFVQVRDGKGKIMGAAE